MPRSTRSRTGRLPATCTSWLHNSTWPQSILAHDLSRGRLGPGGTLAACPHGPRGDFCAPGDGNSAAGLCADYAFRRRRRRRQHGPWEYRAAKVKAMFLLAAVAAMFGLTRLVFAADLDTGPQPGFRADASLLACYARNRGRLQPSRIARCGAPADDSGNQCRFFQRMDLGVRSRLADRGGDCFRDVLLANANIRGPCPAGFCGHTPHRPCIRRRDGLSRESCPPPCRRLCSLCGRSVRSRSGYAAMVATTPGALICRQIPAVAILLLIVSAQADHLTAAELYARAASLSRELVKQIRVRAPGGGAPIHVTLVNMPGTLIAGGIGAFVFVKRSGRADALGIAPGHDTATSSASTSMVRLWISPTGVCT